jgi:hypothetical protein
LKTDKPKQGIHLTNPQRPTSINCESSVLVLLGYGMERWVFEFLTAGGIGIEI